MENENPYKTPEADVAVALPKELADLATLGQRFLGAIIDVIIGLAINLPIMLYTGYWHRALSGQLHWTEQAMWGGIGMVIFIVIHGYTLANYGQTIGKRIVKSQVVSAQGRSILPLGKIIVLRYLPIAIVAQLPIISLLAIVDVLFIFRQDRRCVHDFIAGTVVIRNTHSDTITNKPAS